MFQNTDEVYAWFEQMLWATQLAAGSVLEVKAGVGGHAQMMYRGARSGVIFPVVDNRMHCITHTRVMIPGVIQRCLT